MNVSRAFHCCDQQPRRNNKDERLRTLRLCQSITFIKEHNEHVLRTMDQSNVTLLVTTTRKLFEYKTVVGFTDGRLS
jgi:hypothetical protein